MNQGQIVRADVTEDGVGIVLWIDDERGRHLAVAEVHFTRRAVANWQKEIERDTQRNAQGVLDWA